MSRLLKDLTPEMYAKSCELIALAAEQGIALMIIFTGRTPAEQKALWDQGRDAAGNVVDRAKVVTWTLDSLHVMTPARGMKSDAIDVCSYEQYQLNGPDKLQWKDDDPVWAKLGAIGQSIGLKWGVVFKDGKRGDLGHFEYVRKATSPIT